MKHRLISENRLEAVRELFLDTPIDNFAYNGTSPTYKMRYLIDESFAAGQKNPPILFYCGNEGGVYAFYENSGFITKTLAAQFKAVVLFAEHRYYGTSLPFRDSFAPDHIKYLTVDQTMMDYVKLLQKIKASNANYAKSPVIAFGGSYGGMLAAWIRMKYPHMIQGALASSAPIMFFPGSVSPYAYNELVTRSFNEVRGDVDITSMVRNGFATLKKMATDPTQYKSITDMFKTCRPITNDADITALMNAIADGFGTMAMVNYPYPTNFINSLPANPIKYSCEQVSQYMPSPRTDLDRVKVLQLMINVF